VPDWTDDAWRAGVLAWLRDELHDLGDELTSAPDQFHLRPWSTIWRVATRRGTMYLKAVPVHLAHEVRLTQWLSERFPERVARVLAADPARGLLLLRDGGARLRDVGTDLRGWCRVASEYAALQLLAGPGVAELLAHGVPDRRLALLPGALASALDEREGDLVARYAARCAALSSVGLPDTVQMDDLHDGNVLLDGGRPRFFDWGDASIAQPFFSLPMLLGTAAERLGLSVDGPEVARIRDAYLERFSGLAPLPALRDAAALAAQVVPTVRILAWQLAHLGTTPAEQDGEWGETLAELIEQQRAALA